LAYDDHLFDPRYVRSYVVVRMADHTASGLYSTLEESVMQHDPIFIVGGGHSRFGRLEETLEELIICVVREAIADAGLTADQIDAVFLGHFNSGLVPDGFASSLIHQATPELRFKPPTGAGTPARQGRRRCMPASTRSSPGRRNGAL